MIGCARGGMPGRKAVGAALLAVAGGPAAAHGGLPGGEGFLSGVVHPLVAIEHLILLLSIGLLAGQRPPAQRSASFAAVGLGLLGGLAATRGGQGVTPFAAPAILALGCLTGGLLALSPTRFPRALLPVLAILAGLAVGLDTDVIGATGAARAVVTASVAGVLTGVYLIVLDAAALGV